MDKRGGIVGRADFDAPDHAQSLLISATIYDACSDIAQRYELWNKDKLVAAPKTVEPGALKALTARQQQIVIDTEIALHDSGSLISESQRLLEQMKTLKPDLSLR